jgi:hypothetical protein
MCRYSVNGWEGNSQRRVTTGGGDSNWVQRNPTDRPVFRGLGERRRPDKWSRLLRKAYG